MQIYGPFRVTTTQSTSNVQRTNAAAKPAEAPVADRTGPVDQLELSQQAQSATRLESSGAVAGEGIRFERVAEIRRQIADGSYDTPERMDAAMDRFLDLLG
ncbi:flagellar biosynthesis anti-sigma factor FlgM [Roseiconus nitratireducens]|uniref:Flagellar biosynthesis anti-sigma factor FlgM n=2 Tax=Roseiconus nitratireducens TaxID=2605748 RepID=A0A5M6DAS9_9BACT|nr:flagellar biosynthesis anti-sigma factor FlgM [Roseiconus nitratireducens]